MPPRIKQALYKVILDDYYKKFYYFFNDIQGKNFANKEFARRIVTHLDCTVFYPGQTFIEQGKEVHSLYFIHKGIVRLVKVINIGFCNI